MLYHALWLFCICLFVCLFNSCNFLSKHKVEPKPVMTCTHAFSRHWCRSPASASSSDWFIVLLVSVLFGQREYFLKKTGLNVQAWIFFRLFFYQPLKLISLPARVINISLFHPQCTFMIISYIHSQRILCSKFITSVLPRVQLINRLTKGDQEVKMITDWLAVIKAKIKCEKTYSRLLRTSAGVLRKKFVCAAF